MTSPSDGSAADHDGIPTLSEALAALPSAVLAVRSALRLSRRQAAGQMGLNHVTLSRLEKGGNCTVENLIAAARWVEGTHQKTASEATHE